MFDNTKPYQTIVGDGFKLYEQDGVTYDHNFKLLEPKQEPQQNEPSAPITSPSKRRGSKTA